jgi:carbon-monoxide dehydrogenase medium subunit
MIPARFGYLAPRSVAQVLDLLAERGDEIKVMAGGQSLVPLLRLRLASPETIVDLGALTELRLVEDLGPVYRVGAMVTHRALLESPVAQAWDVVRDAGADAADPLVRNRGTFGGSLAHADPAGDWPAVALAVGAACRLQSSSRTRLVAVDDFFTGLFTTALADDELLTQIDIPKPGPGTCSAYIKIPHPASGYPVVGVGVSMTVQDGICRAARLALTGVSLTPLRARPAEAALVGQPVTPDVLAAAAALAPSGVDIIGDDYAPAEYRRHLVEVVTRGVLNRAAGHHLVVNQPTSH